MSTRVSLAELAAADIRLRPAEAVAIVMAVCAQHNAGVIRGIPSLGVIRLTRAGEVVAEGPITTAQDEVARAALLLNDLLSGFDALPEYRASGALRLVVERALGTIDLPAYASLAEFCGALARFSTDDVRDVARGLFAAWNRARSGRAFSAARHTDLTISDVRRARRATGLSLGHLAAVADVPSTRLRDLEWGYMRDWPPTPDGRAQVIRYARAAGLDETLVLSIAWPLILERVGAATGETDPGVALVPAGPQALTVIEPLTPRRSRRWRGAIVAAAATVALIGAFILGSRTSEPETSRHDGMPAGVSGQHASSSANANADRRDPRAVLPPLDVDANADGDAASPAGASPRAESGIGMQPAAAMRPAGTAGGSGTAPRKSPRSASARPKGRHAAPPKRDEPKKDSIFERELFRIVIR